MKTIEKYLSNHIYTLRIIADGAISYIRFDGSVTATNNPNIAEIIANNYVSVGYIEIEPILYMEQLEVEYDIIVNNICLEQREILIQEHINNSKKLSKESI